MGPYLVRLSVQKLYLNIQVRVKLSVSVSLQPLNIEMCVDRTVLNILFLSFVITGNNLILQLVVTEQTRSIRT